MSAAVSAEEATPDDAQPPSGADTEHRPPTTSKPALLTLILIFGVGGGTITWIGPLGLSVWASFGAAAAVIGLALLGRFLVAGHGWLEESVPQRIDCGVGVIFVVAAFVLFTAARFTSDTAPVPAPAAAAPAVVPQITYQPPPVTVIMLTPPEQTAPPQQPVVVTTQQPAAVPTQPSAPEPAPTPTPTPTPGHGQGPPEGCYYNSAGRPVCISPGGRVLAQLPDGCLWYQPPLGAPEKICPSPGWSGPDSGFQPL